MVGFFKIFGALFLVFPGIVARNIFGDLLINTPDEAYPNFSNRSFTTNDVRYFCKGSDFRRDSLVFLGRIERNVNTSFIGLL